MTLDKFLEDMPRRRLEYQKQKEKEEKEFFERWDEELRNYPICMPRHVRGA